MRAVVSTTALGDLLHQLSARSHQLLAGRWVGFIASRSRGTAQSPSLHAARSLGPCPEPMALAKP